MKSKKLLIPLFIVSAFLFLAPLLTLAQTAEKPFVPLEPKLQINIPTLEFSKITKEGQMINVPYIADYIAGIYKYAVGIVSLVAIIVVMIGGLRWMTAGGNASSIGAAKEMISGAVVGLFLVLGSYLVLFTINPDLVSFKQLQIKLIEAEQIQASWIDLTDDDFKTLAGGATVSGSGNIPLFVQFPSPKSPWANNHCGPDPSNTSKNTIAKAGCGLTSVAMVLKYYFPSQNIDPGTVSLLSSSCSISGLSVDKLSKWGSVALTTMNVKSLDKIQTLVSQGKPVIINCHPCVGIDKTGALSPRKYGGHLMVLTGYNNGNFSVNDPGGYYTSMTTEMITNPCKFVDVNNDNPQKAGVAMQNCKGKAANTNKPGFWYFYPAGK